MNTNLNTSPAEALIALQRIGPVTTTAREGSLPFKKRRFWIPSLDDGQGKMSLKSAATASATTTSSTTDASSDEQLAALALVAAAASSNAPPETTSSQAKGSLVSTTTASTTTSCSLVDVLAAAADYAEENQLTAASQTDETDPTTGVLISSSSSTVAASSGGADASQHKVSNKTKRRQSQSSQLSLKVATAEVAVPLPNTCHGKTSRTHSYCKRLPCYKGSQYCKLHYHQYVVAEEAGVESGASTTNKPKKVANTSSGSTKEQVVQKSHVANSGTKGKKNGEEKEGLSNNKDETTTATAHQDKRYTGCATESRCKATTTRGRECSYCAVKGTKYCYLHADYDTNPPPRRGASTSNSTHKVGKDAESSDGGSTGNNSDGTNEAPPSSATTSNTNKPNKKVSTSTRRLSTVKNLEKRQADSPYPLLSTLATDQWLNRKVVVSSGPLANHVGVVEKWRNGWVSVLLPGAGLHNRRSFELYLHPDSDGAEGGSTTSSNQTKQHATNSEKDVVEVFDPSAAAAAAAAKCTKNRSSPVRDIQRMISHDSELSFPTPLNEGKALHVFSKGNALAHEVTPLNSCRIIGMESKRANIMFPSSLRSSSSPATVPESPMPSEESVADSEVGSKEGAASDGSEASSVHHHEEDAPIKSISQSNKKFKLPIKTMSTTNKEDEMPLVESMMLAQKGLLNKHKMGLLFGTAALERSRRNVHKPKIYDASELTTQKKKKTTKSRKRSREITGTKEAGSAASPKRRLSDEADYSTPKEGIVLISSSDEETATSPMKMVSV